MRLLRNDQSLLITHTITHKHTKTEPELAAMVTDSSVVFYGYSEVFRVHITIMFRTDILRCPQDKSMIFF